MLAVAEVDGFANIMEIMNPMKLKHFLRNVIQMELLEAPFRFKRLSPKYEFLFFANICTCKTFWHMSLAN